MLPHIRSHFGSVTMTWIVIILFAALRPPRMELSDLDRLGEIAELGGEYRDVGAASSADDVLDRCDALGAMQAVAGDVAADIDALERLVDLGRRRPAAPQQKRKLEWRSCEAMEVARQALKEKRQAQVVARAEARSDELASQLSRVARNFPKVARACEVALPSRSNASASGDDGTSDRFCVLVRACFEAHVPRGLDVKHEKLLCFAATLAMDLQSRNLMVFLQKCAYFRLASTPSVKNLVIVGYSHESDGTSQQLAQHAISKIGRPSAQRLSTEVVNQSGFLRAKLLQVDRESGDLLESVWVRQPWHTPSVVVLAKTAPFVLEALLRGLPFSMGGLLWQDWKELLELACDKLVFDQAGDKASSNLPALKHLTCVMSEVSPSLVDIGVCELHVLQSVKSTLPHSKLDIGKMFSLSNVSRVAGFHYGLVTTIAHLCHTTIRRIVSPPPEDTKSDLHLLLDKLYDFQNPHHGRRSQDKSLLWQDALGLANFQLHPLHGQSGDTFTRIHFCWDFATGKACCESEEETC